MYSKEQVSFSPITFNPNGFIIPGFTYKASPSRIYWSTSQILHRFKVVNMCVKIRMRSRYKTGRKARKPFGSRTTSPTTCFYFPVSIKGILIFLVTQVQKSQSHPSTCHFLLSHIYNQLLKSC